MFRWFEALPLTFALAALSLFASSCGSSHSQSQLRVVHAISNGPALDVKVNSTTLFTNTAFTGVQPIPPAYTKVGQGSVTLEAVNTGTTTAVIANTSTSLNGSAQYTLLMTGLINGIGANAPTFFSISDTNSAPTAGNVGIRIIDGSTNTFVNGFDVYIVPPGTNIQNVTPQITGLLLGQASSYQSLNIGGGVYEVIVTQSGSQTSYVNQNYTINPGQIRTFVIVDTQGGGQISAFPLELSDLN